MEFNKVDFPVDRPPMIVFKLSDKNIVSPLYSILSIINSSSDRTGFSISTDIRYSGSKIICFKPSKVKSALIQLYLVPIPSKE